MVKVNKDRISQRIEALAEFGKDPEGGWSRPTFSDEYLKAENLIKKWMEEAGMTVRTDAIGNLIGRLDGEEETGVVASGSHIDSVKNGGRLDGNVGVIAALEVAQTISENKIAHKHPIEVIVFAEEEGSRWGTGLLGSRAMLGQISEDLLHEKKDQDGITIAEALESVGLDPHKIQEAKVEKGYYKNFFEVHIEQGSVLDNMGYSIGIVEGISAPVWLKATLKGRADHAGATPMNMRKDAFLAAAEISLEAEKIAKEVGETTVATVGKINVLPGGPNVVPGEVEMFFDVRDIYADQRSKALSQIKEAIEEACAKRGVTYTVEEVFNVDPVVLPKHVVDYVEEGAKETGLNYHRMISGAGHDAQLMAKLTDVGMIFTPSIDGLSHSPGEETRMEDIAICTQVLLNTMMKVI